MNSHGGILKKGIKSKAVSHNEISIYRCEWIGDKVDHQQKKHLYHRESHDDVRHEPLVPVSILNEDHRHITAENEKPEKQRT